MSYKKWLFLRILILSLVVILIASGITFFAVRDAKLKRESDEKAKRIAEILEPLKNERKDIQSDMDSIITEFKTGKYSAGTVMFLVTDTDARLYTEIYRLLLQSTHPGIIVVGEDYQSENDITKEELRTLENANWDIFMKGDKNTDFDKLKKSIQAMNLKDPKGIYFEKGAYDPSLDEIVKELGIETIISYDSVIQIEGIKYSYKAYGYKENDFDEFLGESIDNSDTIAITVGYKNSYELYDNSDFSRVLNRVDGNISYELIGAGNTNYANARYDTLNENTVRLKKEMLEELERLQIEYDLIQERIDEESRKIER